MKNIIIIGATGSTGLYLTEDLSKKDFNIIATGVRERNQSYYKSRNIDYITLDISRKDDYNKLPKENIDCVVLLAGAMPARMVGYNPYTYIEINIIGTLNVLEYCRINKIPKIIFALSHSDVYGHWNTGQLIPEDAKRILNLEGDHAVYIISKVAAADLVEHYSMQYDLQSVIFRMPTIYCYWPDSTFYVDGEKREMAYLNFIKKAINGDEIEIWGDPKKAKDIVYIKDFVQMIEKAILNSNARGIYNVGTGIATTLEDQIKGVIKVFCKPEKISKIIYRPDLPSQTSFIYDISKAQKDFEYVVRYPYIEMLEDMKLEMYNPIFKEILEL